MDWGICSRSGLTLTPRAGYSLRTQSADTLVSVELTDEMRRLPLVGMFSEGWFPNYSSDNSFSGKTGRDA